MAGSPEERPGSGGSEQGNPQASEGEKTRPLRLAILEDDQRMIEWYSIFGQRHGYEVVTYSTVEAFEAELEQGQAFDAMITDGLNGGWARAMELATQRSIYGAVISANTTIVALAEEGGFNSIYKLNFEEIEGLFENLPADVDIFRQSLGGPTAQE